MTSVSGEKSQIWCEVPILNECEMKGSQARSVYQINAKCWIDDGVTIKF